MLAVLFILGALCPLSFAVIPIGLLSTEDGVLTGRFSNSFLLKLPNCSIGELVYQEVGSIENKTILTSCSPNPMVFLLQGLKNGTTYSMKYKVGNETSADLNEATINVSDYQQIYSGLPARSGAMVVITVILSLAMAILVVGIIISVFFF